MGAAPGRLPATILPVADILRFTTTAAPTGILADVRLLLADAFQGRFSDEDWEHTCGGFHLALVDQGSVVAHAAVVARDLDVGGEAWRTGYVEGVGTAPARQGTGLGSQVMAVATEAVRNEFEMGALSTGAHAFYARFGWERWQGPTYVRHGRHLVRTPDEDDGVMVLRFGPSTGIDLTQPIVCEARQGDDW